MNTSIIKILTAVSVALALTVWGMLVAMLVEGVGL